MAPMKSKWAEDPIYSLDSPRSEDGTELPSPTLKGPSRQGSALLKVKSGLVPWGQAATRRLALEDAAPVLRFLVGLDPKLDGQAVLPWQE